MDDHDDREIGTADGELIDLSDTQFDFEGYFARFKVGELSPEESNEFTARVIGMFCRDIFAERKPPEWVLQYVASQFWKVLAGEEWEHAFPLPWTSETPIRSRAEGQALEIFCDIANNLKADSSRKVTDAIMDASEKHHVSYEKARAAYYKHVRSLPQDFLKRGVKT